MDKAMRWSAQSSLLAISDSRPPYRVARFVTPAGSRYRASVGGKFIGKVCENAKEAQAICDNHLRIMGGEDE